MAHLRSDAEARQTALDRMFRMMTDLERVITEADARDARMAAAESARRHEMAERFPAMGGKG